MMKSNDYKNKPKQNISKRRLARCRAMQALYVWHFMRLDPAQIIQQFVEHFSGTTMDTVFFKELVTGVIKNAEHIDTVMQPALDRKIDELNPVECAILRMAIFELIYRIDVPYRVIINEAVEVAKRYGSADGHKYVNGVLDKLAVKLREVEVNKS